MKMSMILYLSRELMVGENKYDIFQKATFEYHREDRYLIKTKSRMVPCLCTPIVWSFFHYKEDL